MVQLPVPDDADARGHAVGPPRVRTDHDAGGWSVRRVPPEACADTGGLAAATAAIQAQGYRVLVAGPEPWGQDGSRLLGPGALLVGG